ncbi:MAG TPA: tyrosine-type recombinase/integrase, partial [Candidatus Cloacimonadota bacterium]|nr:tyrosine-type recombinase/integrase [Candidatus Cloacimonadota bacterium]
MQELIQEFLQHISLEGKSKKTLEGYQIDLEQFREFLQQNFGESVPVALINVLQIRSFLTWLNERPDCNRTLARKMAALNSWFKYLKIRGYRADNPMAKIRRPKFEKKLPKFFSEAEIDLLLSIPDTSTKVGIRNRAIFELIYSCGLRLMETAGISVYDLDFKKRLLRVTGKGNKQRIIPVGSRALDALQEYLKVRPQFLRPGSSEKLFLTHHGKDFDTAQLHVILMRYIALIAREKGYSPHTIRHSFATHLLSRG